MKSYLWIALIWAEQCADDLMTQERILEFRWCTQNSQQNGYNFTLLLHEVIFLFIFLKCQFAAVEFN